MKDNRKIICVVCVFWLLCSAFAFSGNAKIEKGIVRQPHKKTVQKEEKVEVKQEINKDITPQETQSKENTDTVPYPYTEGYGQELELPNISGEFKPYMDYRMLNIPSSPQYKLQEQAYTDENGLRRIGEYYCGALGSAYGSEIGTKYLVTLSTGKQFKLILADQKADEHTDDTNRYCVCGTENIIEFLVDTDSLNQLALQMGDVSYIDGLSGEIVKLERI